MPCVERRDRVMAHEDTPTPLSCARHFTSSVGVEMKKVVSPPRAPAAQIAGREVGLLLR
jgi:hypothetical protein